MSDERRRELFHALLIEEKHPRVLAEEWGTTAEAIYQELDELGLHIPHRLMPVDPVTQLPNARVARWRKQDLAGWLAPGEAALLLGVTTKGVRKIAEREGIEVRWTAGYWGKGGTRGQRGDRRYREEDVRRVARARAAEGRDVAGWWIRLPENQEEMQARRRETGKWN